MGKKNKQKKNIIDIEKYYFTEPFLEENVFHFHNRTMILDFCNVFKIEPKKVFKVLGVDDENTILSEEQILILFDKFKLNYDFKKLNFINHSNILNNVEDLILNDELLLSFKSEPKTPVVTIMGHVDHGKTTLLDYIRKSSLTDAEVGGITQSIGGYQINWKNKPISFIDTPGHEAFTEMRVRGSKITDIAIIVVSATESIKPQTKESIEIAQKYNIPIIIAITMSDKHNANPNKVMEDLLSFGLDLEKYNGRIPAVPVSGISGEGVDTLLDNVLLQFDLLEKITFPELPAMGSVIETDFDKFKGNLISVIIENGTLHKGDILVFENQYSKVKSITNDRGIEINEAKQGLPIVLFGFSEIPDSGSKFIVINDKKKAEKFVKDSLTSRREYSSSIANMDVDDLFDDFNSDKKKINLIVKTNNFGILNTIQPLLENLENDDAKINLVKISIGDINQNDIELASTSNSTIYSFQLNSNQKMIALAKEKGINIVEHSIIYKLIEEVEEILKSYKKKKFDEVFTGELQILKIFKFSKIGNIAGCRIISGTITRDSIIEVIREDKVISKTTIESLKVEKDNVKELSGDGRECGIVFKDFSDIKENDIIKVYKLIEKE